MVSITEIVFPMKISLFFKNAYIKKDFTLRENNQVFLFFKNAYIKKDFTLCENNQVFLKTRFTFELFHLQHPGKIFQSTNTPFI